MPIGHRDPKGILKPPPLVAAVKDLFHHRGPIGAMVKTWVISYN
jgi:hypothetical protein